MSLDLPLEELIKAVQGLDRDQCKDWLLRRIERPRLDFTESFLDGLTLDRLHHILIAACLQAQKHAHASKQ